MINRRTVSSHISLFIGLTTYFILSCEEKKKNTIPFAERMVYADSSVLVSIDQCHPDSGGCNYIKYDWPYFHGNSNLDRSLNQAVRSMLAPWDAEGQGAANPYQEGERFKSEYLSLQKAMGADWQENWYFQQSVGLSAEFNSLIGMYTEIQRSLGGAHPSYQRRYLIVSKESGMALKQYEMIDSLKVDQLCQKVTELFRMQKQIPDEQALADLGYSLSSPYLPLPDAIGLDPEGLVFYYQPYSIAPYAMGDTELLIPFAQIKNFLLPSFQKMISDGPIALPS